MTEREPVVSIVVPTFSRPAFLRQALASVLAQTLADFEVLVCDNGGDDETADVVAECADPRIIHVRRPHDIGMMPNAIDGFRRARGRYVLKLDDDDILYPTALHDLTSAFIRDDVTVTFAPFDLVDVDGNRLVDATTENEHRSGRAELGGGIHQPYEKLVTSGAVALTCALLRRSAIDWDAVPDDVATAYDRHLALQAARDGAAAVFVPHPLAAYRLHPASDSVTALTRQSLGSLRAVERAWQERRHVDMQTILGEAQHRAAFAGRRLLLEGRPREARAVLGRALRRRPDEAAVRLWMLTLLPAAAAQWAVAARHTHYLRRRSPFPPQGAARPL